MTHLNLQPTALIDSSPDALELLAIVSPTNGLYLEEVAFFEGLTAGFPLAKVPSVVGSTEIFSDQLEKFLRFGKITRRRI